MRQSGTKKCRRTRMSIPIGKGHYAASLTIRTIHVIRAAQTPQLVHVCIENLLPLRIHVQMNEPDFLATDTLPLVFLDI